MADVGYAVGLRMRYSTGNIARMYVLGDVHVQRCWGLGGVPSALPNTRDILLLDPSRFQGNGTPCMLFYTP